MKQRTSYLLLLCREKALGSEAQLMMVREPLFHGQMLCEGAMRHFRVRVVPAKEAKRA